MVSNGHAVEGREGGREEREAGRQGQLREGRRKEGIKEGREE